MNFQSFLACLFLFDVGAVVLRGVPFAEDVFETGNADGLRQLADLPIHDLAALKRRHAGAVGRYDIGLFGNSRAVQVGADDIGIDAERFFNFSVPGTTLRQSVELLELLVSDGTAPRVAIISVDNAALHFQSRLAYPGLIPRLPTAVAGYGGIWRSADGGWQLAVRAVIDDVRTGWGQIRHVYSFGQIYSRLSFMLPRLLPAGRRFEVAFRRDGSRPMPMPQTPPAAMALPPERPFVLAGAYLDQDLDRLADIQARGVVVLLYESPLYPDDALQAAAAAAPEGRRLREQFFARCRALGLDCRPAARLGRSGAPPFWPDCCHAPAALLGPYIAGLVAKLGA